MKKSKQNNLIKIAFILGSIAFAMPSILYLIQKKTVFAFGPYFQFLYNEPSSRTTQTFLYLLVLAILSVFYFAIIKNRKENVFVYCYHSINICDGITIFIF